MAPTRPAPPSEAAAPSAGDELAAEGLVPVGLSVALASSSPPPPEAVGEGEPPPPDLDFSQVASMSSGRSEPTPQILLAKARMASFSSLEPQPSATQQEMSEMKLESLQMQSVSRRTHLPLILPSSMGTQDLYR